MPSHSRAEPTPADRSAWAVFLIFLRLGLTSFGGPVAHLGYFRTEFVERRRWLGEAAYADLVALCQFLPGPASSQVGMAIGLSRAGYAGAFAAWVGFTLPSAIALILFALGLASAGDAVAPGALHGLKVVAVAVVAQAVWAMARSLCPDALRRALMLASAALLLFWPGTAAQLLAMAAAALPTQALALVDAFYRAGALVFGGGHVVLPLLQAEVVPTGWVSQDAFLAGYGAAQAVPGPLFTFAAFLGASMSAAPTGWLGGLIALLAVFAPSFLLIAGALPFWESLRRQPRVRAALMGINAAVVGLLLAALWNPVITSAVHGVGDVLLAGVAMVALMKWKWPPWVVVAGCAGVGWVMGAVGV